MISERTRRYVHRRLCESFPPYAEFTPREIAAWMLPDTDKEEDRIVTMIRRYLNVPQHSHPKISREVAADAICYLLSREEEWSRSN